MTVCSSARNWCVSWLLLGILILTSNRVGIFDEAFKSRIQLTLRYKTLEEPQRRQIWENFISRLESFQNSATTSLVPHSSRSHLYQDSDLGINVQEVRSKLPELAQAKLNGREIRNAISTARQLAMFERKLMGYEHLRVVIEESRKFEEYLTELRKGFTPDEIMKDIGERWASDFSTITIGLSQLGRTASRFV